MNRWATWLFAIVLIGGALISVDVVSASVCGTSPGSGNQRSGGTVLFNNIEDVPYSPTFHSQCISDCEAAGADICQIRKVTGTSTGCSAYSGGTTSSNGDGNYIAVTCTGGPSGGGSHECKALVPYKEGLSTTPTATVSRGSIAECQDWCASYLSSAYCRVRWQGTWITPERVGYCAVPSYTCSVYSAGTPTDEGLAGGTCREEKRVFSCGPRSSGRVCSFVGQNEIVGASSSLGSITVSTNDECALFCESSSADSCHVGYGFFGGFCTAYVGGSLSFTGDFTDSAALCPLVNAPTVDLSTSKYDVALNEGFMLSYTSTDATSCSSDFGSSGTSDSIARSETSAGTRTYTVSCSGPGGSASDTVFVTAHNAPTIDSFQFVGSVTPVGDGAWIVPGASKSVSWSSTGAASCTANGWKSSGAVSGSDPGWVTTSTTERRTQYDLTCTGPGGTVSRTIYLYYQPKIVSFSLAKSSVIYGENNSISWNVQNAYNCFYSVDTGLPYMENVNWKNDGSISGSQALPYEGARTYRIYCDNEYGHRNDRSINVALADTWFCIDADDDGYYEGKNFQATPTASYPELCTDVDPSCTGDPDSSCGKFEPTSCGSDPSRNPGVVEVCSDGVDNDCDGFIDEEDVDCNIQLTFNPISPSTNGWTSGSTKQAIVSAADGSLYATAYKVCDNAGCSGSGICDGVELCRTTTSGSTCDVPLQQNDTSYLYYVCAGENQDDITVSYTCTNDCTNAQCLGANKYQNCQNIDLDSCTEVSSIVNTCPEDANECTGAQSVCSAPTGSCTQSPSPLATVCSTGVCDGAGSCVACTSNAQCAGATPVCDTLTHTCVECTTAQSAACIPGSQVCNDATNTCVECTSVNDSVCVALGTTCNTLTNTCVECTSDAQCGGATPVCDLASNVCVQCTAANSSQCVSPTDICDTTSNTCEECTVPGPSQCTGTEVCDTALKLCVECMSNFDCSASTVCDLADNTCKECTASDTSKCSAGESCIANACTLLTSNVTVNILPDPLPSPPGKVSYFLRNATTWYADNNDSTILTYTFEDVPAGRFQISARSGEYYGQEFRTITPPNSVFVTLVMEKSFCSDTCVNGNNLCTYSCLGSSCMFNETTSNDKGLGYWAAEMSVIAPISVSELSSLMVDRCVLAPDGSARSIPGYPGYFFNCCGSAASGEAPIRFFPTQPTTITGCPKDLMKTITIGKDSDQRLLIMNVLTWQKCVS